MVEKNLSDSNRLAIILIENWYKHKVSPTEWCDTLKTSVYSGCGENISKPRSETLSKPCGL